MENKIWEAWEERSRKYGTKPEGVLPKSLPAPVNDYLNNWMFEQIRWSMKTFKKAVVLDLGCGYGRLSKQILDEFKNLSIVGIDVSQTYVDLYNKNLSPRGRAIRGDIRNLPFKDSFFNVVFMVTTLMYIIKKPDQEKVCDEIFRVLKPGGRFVIIERNPIGQNIITFGGLISKIRGRKHKEIPAASFRKDYLTGLIKKSGGFVIQTRGIPAWTLLLPLSIIIFTMSQNLARKFLGLVESLDNLLSWFLTPSLYISYTGTKKK